MHEINSFFASSWQRTLQKGEEKYQLRNLQSKEKQMHSKNEFYHKKDGMHTEAQDQ